MELAQQQLAKMEEDFENLSSSMKSMQAEHEAVNTARMAAEREDAVWSSQRLAMKASLRSVEKEFAEACKAAAMSRVELQAGVENLEIQSIDLEADIERLTLQIAEVRKEASATEVEADTRASAGEVAVKDHETQLADLRRRLIATLEQQHRLETETSHAREIGIEKQVSLEKYISDVVNECIEERAAFQSQLSAEQKAARLVKEQFIAEQENGKSKLSLMQEESRLRLQAAEKERKHVEEIRRRERNQVAGTAGQHHEQTEALESALDRSRQLLHESSANLGFVLQELAHEERESALEISQLREEVRMLDVTLEKASREERDLDHRFGSDVVMASTVAALSPHSPQGSMSSPRPGTAIAAALHDSGLRSTPPPSMWPPSTSWSPRAVVSLPFTPPVRSSAGGSW